jgi:hypothetical protein
MQFERFYSLNHSLVAWFAHLHHLGFHPKLSQIWGNSVCGNNGVSVQPYAHPQQVKMAQTSYICMTLMWDAV